MHNKFEKKNWSKSIRKSWGNLHPATKILRGKKGYVRKKRFDNGDF